MEATFKEAKGQPRHAVIKVDTPDGQVSMKVIVLFDGSWVSIYPDDVNEEKLRDELAYEVFQAVADLITGEEDAEGSGGEIA